MTRLDPINQPLLFGRAHDEGADIRFVTGAHGVGLRVQSRGRIRAEAREVIGEQAPGRLAGLKEGLLRQVRQLVRRAEARLHPSATLQCQ